MTRHILLSLCGRTPQILTETLYCMMVQQHIPIDEIRLITTQSGRETALKHLFDEKQGYYFQFCRDYDIDPCAIHFDPSMVIAPGDLSDILNVHDSESFANLLTAAVWELTRDDELVLHCSIAGGRKTMSAYLAMIMQFFARPQDRLYHVLIGAAEFENNPQYYYPPPQPRWITDREGYAVSTDQAGLVLVEIPFIRLRGQIKEFQDQYYSFTQMVEIAQKWIQSPPEHPRLILDARHCEVRIGDGRPIPMPKTRFFIYRWFAEFSRRRPDDVPLCDYERYFLHGGKQLPEEAKRLLCSFNEKFGEWTDEDFWPRVQQEISRINKQLREALASREVDPYLIAVKGRYAEKYYGILLDKRCITLL